MFIQTPCPVNITIIQKCVYHGSRSAVANSKVKVIREVSVFSKDYSKLAKPLVLVETAERICQKRKGESFFILYSLRTELHFMALGCVILCCYISVMTSTVNIQIHLYPSLPSNPTSQLIIPFLHSMVSYVVQHILPLQSL